MTKEKKPEKPAKPEDDLLDTEIDETKLEDDLRVILGARPLPFAEREPAMLAARRPTKAQSGKLKPGKDDKRKSGSVPKVNEI